MPVTTIVGRGIFALVVASMPATALAQTRDASLPVAETH